MLKTWAAAVPSFWTDALAWAPAGEPANGDDVVFDGTSLQACDIMVNTNRLNSFRMSGGFLGTVTLNPGATFFVDWTADGSDFTGIQGAFIVAANDIIRVSGDFDISSALFGFAAGTGDIQLTGTGTVAFRAGVVDSPWNVTCGYAGKVTTLASDLIWRNVLQVVAGRLDKAGFVLDGNNSGVIDVDGTLRDRNDGFDQAIPIQDCGLDVSGILDFDRAWLIRCEGTGGGAEIEEGSAILEGCDMSLISLRKGVREILVPQIPEAH